MDWFQHTAARRRLDCPILAIDLVFEFQHTAARRRLASLVSTRSPMDCFNTQPPEGGWIAKAAKQPKKPTGFNTQPPEGGWVTPTLLWICRICFNTQPPEGGWAVLILKSARLTKFQHTAARRRLGTTHNSGISSRLFQHTAARRRLD